VPLAEGISFPGTKVSEVPGRYAYAYCICILHMQYFFVDFTKFCACCLCLSVSAVERMAEDQGTGKAELRSMFRDSPRRGAKSKMKRAVLAEVSLPVSHSHVHCEP